MQAEIKQELRDGADKVEAACQGLGLAVVKSGRVPAFRAYIIQLAKTLQELRATIEEQ